jgi:hypothetical protein
MTATRVVSYSELDAIRQCGLKAYLAYGERWKPPTTGPALARGSLFHKVMEAHYTSGWTARSKNVDAVLGTAELSDEEIALVRWVYEGYVECYGMDKDWEVLEVEHKVEDWLPMPSGKRSTFRLKGTIDLLVRDHSAGDGLWIVDHKTCKNLPKGKEIDFDDQMGLYVYLLRHKGIDVRGIIYNACRTDKLKREMTMDERFDRILTVRTDRELEIIAAEALTTFRDYYTGLQRGSREGVMPPRSPNADTCRWRCSYTEACLSSRKGIDLRGLLEDMDYHKDPTRH